jgi:hypothetical protein
LIDSIHHKNKEMNEREGAREKKRNSFFFFLLLFEHLTIPWMNVVPRPHTPSNYREESLGSSPKILARGFQVKTS